MIVDKNNLFLGKTKVLSLLSGHVSDPLGEEIEKEVTSQIEKLLDAGVTITHIDSHHHIHIFPAVAPIVMKAAQKYGIHRMRIPDEPSNTLRNLPPDQSVTEEAEFFSLFATGQALVARMGHDCTGLLPGAIHERAAFPGCACGSS